MLQLYGYGVNKFEAIKREKSYSNTCKLVLLCIRYALTRNAKIMVA